MPLLEGTGSTSTSPPSSHPLNHIHHPYYSHLQTSGIPIPANGTAVSSSSSTNTTSSSITTSDSGSPASSRRTLDIGASASSTNTTSSSTHSSQPMSSNAQASTSKLPPTSVPLYASLKPIPPFQPKRRTSETDVNNNSSSSTPSSSQANGSWSTPNHSKMNIKSPNVNGSNSLQMPTTAADLMREGPRDFTVIKDVGDGSFGTVCLADWKSPLPSGTVLSPMQHPTTRPEYVGKRLVAIKKMKKPFPNWSECMKLKELKSLLAIPHHPNIIPLYDAFLEPTSRELHFVFECMEGNLYQLTKSRKGRPLAGGLVASIYVQIIKGLHHIHEHGYFHRDMKPENLLITTTGVTEYAVSGPYILPGTPPERDVLVIVKLADFGLARETNSRPPYTEYVSTRWYRAPEVLLRSRDYSNPVDMWALGTILAELVNLKPLFPGQSEVDQVLQICEILGDPIRDYGRDERQRVRGGGLWERGIKMAKAVGFQFPKAQPVQFASLFRPRVPPNLIDCIRDLLRYEPKARLTTKQCMDHPYYTEDAPRLQPIPTRPPQQQQKAIIVPAQGNRVPATLLPLPIPDRIQTDQSQRSLPPSHSNQPPANKLPFGAKVSAAELRQLPPLRNPQQPNGQSPNNLTPYYPQPNSQQIQAPASSASSNMHRGASNGSGSPMREDGVPDIAWAPQPGVASRNSSISHYPDFPDSASTYAGSYYAPSQAGGSIYRGETGSVAQSSEVSAMQDRRHPREAARGTVYDDELSRQRQMHDLNGSASVLGSTSDLSVSDFNDSVGSNETLNQKDNRKGRAWGLNISSVFNSNGVDPSAPGGQARNGVGTSFDEKRDVVPSQQKQPAVSLDPKKAKKEAEKAAKEQRIAQDKAKRAAQEKAARDRARAVMHKRNQLLATTHGKEQTGWTAPVNLVGEDLVSEKAKGKQPLHISSPLINTGSNGSSVNCPANRISQSSRLGSTGYSSSSLNPGPPVAGIARGAGQSRSNVSTRQVVDDDPYSPHYGLASPELNRLRMENSGDARRASMQSFATGESDPGPGPNSYRHPAAMQRVGSSSSLQSAPSIVDSSGRFAGSIDSLRRDSYDTRSISSLDHQLITNMENMTAAEARRTTPGGNASPGPSKQFGNPRPSGSRQSRSRGASRTSSSHNRQGSSSPLHHPSGIPRFHPYSNQPGSSHSHQSFTLPPLQLHDGLGSSGPRTSSRRNRGFSQGSATGSETSGYPVPSPAQNYAMMQSENVVNPMFQVSEQQDQEMASPLHYQSQDSQMFGQMSLGGGAATTLPPFSELAAVAAGQDDGGDNKLHSNDPLSNNFYSNQYQRQNQLRHDVSD